MVPNLCFIVLLNHASLNLGVNVMLQFDLFFMFLSFEVGTLLGH